MCYNVKKMCRKSSPSGEGTGEGPAGEGGGASISRNTNHANRKCQDILQAIPLYNREKVELEARRGSLAIKNTPFLLVEDALLGPRRASSALLLITY